MENYFNYFTEIEEHYQRRRGAALLLSTLDWALIETWKDAGIPLAAVLRGIDSSFDAFDRKPERARTRKINSLAYCSQEVLAAAEDLKEAATGTTSAGAQPEKPAGLASADVGQYLRGNAAKLAAAEVPAGCKEIVDETAVELRRLAEQNEAAGETISLEEMERRLAVLEERLFAGLVTAAAPAELLAVQEQAERDLAPYRSKMKAAQIEQLQRQYRNKRLLERAKLPRLSLFYM